MRISREEYVKLKSYKDAAINGKALMPEGIRMICEAYNYDAEKIGRHFLEHIGYNASTEKKYEVGYLDATTSDELERGITHFIWGFEPRPEDKPKEIILLHGRPIEEETV